MKIRLDSLKYIYEYLKNTKQLYKVMEDTDEEDITYEDFIQYVINTIVDNIEYDFGINFYDYVDMNNFIEERGY
jgi:ribose 5-phosphate isomerase RpiB